MENEFQKWILFLRNERWEGQLFPFLDLIFKDKKVLNGNVAALIT